jgi:cation:H+ antiporter
MPAVASVVLLLRGRPPVETVELDRRRLIDLAIITAASLYAPLIVIRGRISWQDGLLLIALYALYVRRVSGGDPEPPHLVGVSAAIGELPKRARRRWIGGMMVFAAATVLICAEPFAHSVLEGGTMIGIDPYLLVQWLVPVATEMPELVIALVLIQHNRAGQGVAVLLSSAVSQWTLALGTLPLAYMAGAGSGPLPLFPREQVEMLLTMSQGFLAVSLLVTLRLQRRDAIIMLALWGMQALIPSVLVRVVLTVVYLTLAVDVLLSERSALRSLMGVLRARSSA